MLRGVQTNQAMPLPAASEDVARDQNHEPTLLQRPFMQNIVPFLTSLSFHGGIVVVGLLAYTAVTIARHPLQEQVTPAATEVGLITETLPSGQMPDLWRQQRQNEVQSDQVGISMHASKAPDMSGMLGGAPSDASVMSVGLAQGFGKGGNAIGTGGNGRNGDGDGPPSPFGQPQLGGPQNPVFTPTGAHRIVFVCDASGSMINKMASLKNELQKAVSHLKASQSFSIVFFQDNQSPDVLSPELLRATPQNIRKAGTFLEAVICTGQTKPLPGIEAAFREGPELIYLLTDGDFPDNQQVLTRIRELNKDKRVRINTIAFVDSNDRDVEFIDLLKTIAAENGGKYQHVTEDSLGE